MKKLSSRLLAFLLAAIMIVPLLPAIGTVESHAATNGVQEKINEVMSHFPKDSYFSENGKACSHDAYHTCNNCKVGSVIEKCKSDGWINWSSGSYYTSQWTCCGFANFVFRYVFGCKYKDNKTTVVSNGSISQDTFSKAKVGDIIEFYKYGQLEKEDGTKYYAYYTAHFAVFMGSVTSSGVTLYHANFSDTNKVAYGSWSYSNMISNYKNSSYPDKPGYINIYRAKNYDEINNTCDHNYVDGYCSLCKSWQPNKNDNQTTDESGTTIKFGYYKKIDESKARTSQPYSKLVGDNEEWNIPNDSRVEVFGAVKNGLGNVWYKIRYDGKEGYGHCSHFQFEKEITKYYIDINGVLDGTYTTNITGYGTCDITVNGTKVANDVSDYYTQWPEGSTYTISDIKAVSGKRYTGQSTISGTLTATASIKLNFETSSGIIYSTLDKRTFFLKNKSTGTYLSVQGGTDADRQPIVVSALAASDSHRMNVTGSDGSYKLYPSLSSTRYVNPYYTTSSPAAGNPIELGPGGWESNNDQHWGFEAVSGGYVIRNQRNSNLVLGLSGSKCVMETYSSGKESQIWQIQNLISYDANGGTGAPSYQLKVYGTTLTLSSTVPTREGYTFTGWNTKADGSGNSFAPGASYSTNGNMSLYAQWTSAATYTVIYDANGGTNAPTSQTKAQNADLTLTSSIPEKEYTVSLVDESDLYASLGVVTANATFKGWNTKADGTGTAYAAGGTYKANQNVTLYAQWENPTLASVELPTPTLSGYTFAGWTTLNMTTFRYDPADLSIVISESTTSDSNVYAEPGAVLTLFTSWDLIPTYPVIYNANGGEGVPMGQTKVEDEALTLTEEQPTRAGYTFIGWNTKADGTGTSYAPGATYTVNDNVTLYAQWQKDETPVPVDPDAAQIVVESKTVVHGNEFTVEVLVKNNPGVMSMTLTPAYSDALTLVKTENGTLLSEFNAGKKYVWNANDDVTADGVLFTLTFTTAKDLEPGDYSVNFTLWDSSDSEENDVSFAIVPGVITVTDVAWGDANGDGVVNNKDIVRLKNYIANFDDETGLSSVTITVGADANGDGVVNNKDIVRLKNYIANYDDETGLSTVILGPAK